jgi:signal transduction histidine kinase
MRPLAFNLRLALGCGAFVLVALALLMAAALLHFRTRQIEQVDLELQAAILAPRDAAGLPAAMQPFMAFGRFDDAGQLVASAGDFPAEAARLALSRTGPFSVSQTGESWRFLAGFRENNSKLVIAYDLYEVRDVVLDMVKACLILLPVLSALAAFGVWHLSRRVLEPVRLLTDTATELATSSLNRRVPLPPAEDDVRRLALAFNGMLTRLEKGFEQARRFSADASHEMRTPLTIMRGEISRLLRAPDLPTGVEAKLLSLQEEIGRLERITEQLLLLARFDAGQDGREHHDSLDFSALVREACEDAELLASARGLKLHVSLTDTPPVRGDALLLRRLVLNLLDNATRYNRPNGEVWCELAVMRPMLELRVRNTGMGVSSRERERLFERFFRADASRARGGHGLGLALSREIARSHGGELELVPDSGEGLTEFRLTLPPERR